VYLPGPFASSACGDTMYTGTVLNDSAPVAILTCTSCGPSLEQFGLSGFTWPVIADNHVSFGPLGWLADSYLALGLSMEVISRLGSSSQHWFQLPTRPYRQAVHNMQDHGAPVAEASMR